MGRGKKKKRKKKTRLTSDGFEPPTSGVLDQRHNQLDHEVGRFLSRSLLPLTVVVLRVVALRARRNRGQKDKKISLLTSDGFEPPTSGVLDQRHNQLDHEVAEIRGILSVYKV